MVAMPALFSSSFRVPVLRVASLVCTNTRCVASAAFHLASISRSSKLEIRGFSSKTNIFRDHIRCSPGWFNLSQVHSRLLTAAASRVYSMATPDAAPSIVVYVTVPNKETGTKLAHSIIENKLAACVNQIPGVESTYWWEGKVETDTEILLMIKTRQALLGELTDHVNNNHPYDTPEVIALPITGGSEKYLKWIGDNTKRAELA
ncbi:protein CutA 1, chloroplastic isoform X6 [Physcomitrium patens]|uniref:Uncharacterized protein n=1 Tax=Physcomitrium patens TaxID=3218 RepID=A0A7I4CCY7_PHYPA